MSNKAELTQAVLALRAEIDSLEDTDDSTREELSELANLMEARLNGVEPAADSSPADTVMAVIESYEAKYPRVTAMANDLMTRLAAMGI